MTRTKPGRRFKLSLGKDVRNDIKAAQKLRLPWWGVLCIAIGSLPFFLLFDRFGRLNIALPALNCIGVLAFVVAFKWKLRRSTWFWIVMTAIAGLHLALLLFIPWTTKWVPAIAIGAIDSVDFCIALWILAVVGKLVQRSKASET